VGGLLTVDGQRAFQNAEVRMAQAESDYWLFDTNQKRAPELIREMFPIARAAASLYQAEGRWKPFSDFGEVTPGVKAIPLTGHTAGHTGFQITSQGKTLLIWGDLVHSSAVETANAKVGFAFDTDGKLAIATRQQLFAKVEKEGLLVAGMHMPFPGIGHLQKNGRSYRWIPVEYSSGLD
jgi:glyoxylase-like metal-dependent hydrolase (beta-lactamase superfamily II)